MTSLILSRGVRVRLEEEMDEKDRIEEEGENQEKAQRTIWSSGRTASGVSLGK
jgi:hypothetical protein